MGSPGDTVQSEGVTSSMGWLVRCKQRSTLCWETCGTKPGVLSDKTLRVHGFWCNHALPVSAFAVSWTFTALHALSWHANQWAVPVLPTCELQVK